MSLAASAKRLVWKHSSRGKVFEDSRTMGSSGSDAAVWRGFFCGTEHQRQIAATADSRSYQRSGLGPCCCLTSRCRLLPHQRLGEGASPNLQPSAFLPSVFPQTQVGSADSADGSTESVHRLPRRLPSI